MTTLRPLPQSILTASALRRIAADLIQQAEVLEAESGAGQYEPRRRVELAWMVGKESKNRRAKR